MSKKLDERGITVASAVIIAVIITAIVVGGGVYVATPKVVTETVTKGVLPEVKAGFIYVGPIGDYGWTFAHDRGRRIVDEKYEWLTTTTAESVSPADLKDYIDRMFVDEKCDVVFTTSFGYMIDTVAKGEEYPDKFLYHCSGDPTPYKEMTGEDFVSKNTGFYFADFYQIYYMNGLMAGALTETDKIGYVAAHTTSEVCRHLNAFMIGAREVNPDVAMKVIETGAWYDPGASTTATKTLIDWGADVIAFTVDSPAVIRACQKHYEDTGERIYSFSHYTPMKAEGPEVVVSGQLVHWEKLYEHLVIMVQQRVAEPQQHWALLAQEAVEMGSDWGESINPKFVDKLKGVTVTDPVFGTISVYDLIMKRLDQFKQARVTYHPFTGLLKDHKGNQLLKEGEVILQVDLRWNLDKVYVEGIIPP